MADQDDDRPEETPEVAAEAAAGDDDLRSTPTRRKFLVGTTVAGSAAIVGAAFGLSRCDREPSPTDHVTSARVDGPVPADDPTSSVWKKGKEARILLDGQNIAVPMRAEPVLRSVDVRSVHDGKTIGFLVEWEDPERDDLTVACDGFRDACGVLLAPGGSAANMRMMGAKDSPVTLLHWKADWQRDLDDGFQGLEAAFPNTAVDYYPPLAAGTAVGSVDEYRAQKATMWLPGLHVANPIAVAEKTTAVEKLTAQGYGSATTLPTQDAAGRGVWENGTWKVALAKPMTASDDGEIALTPGQDYGLAVAVWSGLDRDSGGHKSPSKLLLSLHVEAGS